MADRRLLAISDIPLFSEWLASRGWKILETNGDYECLRAKRNNETLILFARDGAKVHVSIQDKDVPVVREFIKQKIARKEKCKKD